jgi:Fe-S cluster assembly ATPase SufC
MHTLTARIDNQLYLQSQQAAKIQGIKLSSYVRLALQMLNAQEQKKLRTRRLQQSSLKVRAQSQAINAEFAAFENDSFD